MAKITVGPDMPDFGWLEDFFDTATLGLSVQEATSATYEDQGGAKLVFSGKNLRYEDGEITGGKITAIEFLDIEGGVLLTVDGGNYKAAKLTADLNDDVDFWSFLSAVTAGKDMITGGAVGSDLNFGTNHGNDRIVAGDGDAFMSGSEGNDTYLGGAGWDTLSFEDSRWQDDATKGIKLDAKKGTIRDSWGDKDTFKAIEEFRGSFSNDVMKGGGGDENLMGMAGKDKIDGGKGYDELRYHRDERYEGGDHGIVVDLGKGKITDGFGDVDKVKNIESIAGTYLDDTFKGDAKDNQFRGVSGVDSFDGGAGTDEINFDWWEDLGQEGVKVDLTLSSGQIIDDGFGNTENAVSIEAIAGTAFADEIRLGAASGWAIGREGDDRLIASSGENFFEGGEGADTFVFLAASDSLAGTSARDFIEDFSQADGDRIDLSAFAGASFAGNVAFFVNQDGNTVVTVEAGDSDLEFVVNGAVTLTESDFIFA